MPLDGPVPFFSQNAGPSGPEIDDPTGCWYACARMISVYYGGPYSARKAVPELDNPDGTHKGLPMAGPELNTFLRNERLIPVTTRLSTPDDFDAALTNSGPIMVNWWVPGRGLHVSVIVGIMEKDVVYHDPAVGPNQSMLATMLNLRRTGPMGSISPMYVRDPKTIGRRPVSPAKELVLASDGVTKKYPLPWPTGWWRVWDGGTWYYYLGDNRIAMSSKTPPSNTEPPAKTKIHNTGTWVRTSPRSLVVTWKQVAGAPKKCEETFWNALDECERMDATSNLYSPLVATRFRAP